MARLAVVSNRVPDPGADCGAGGLVTALVPVLQERGGIWLGWSGRAGPPGATATSRAAEGFTLATLDLSQAEIKGYYEALANRALWPALHGRVDLVRIDHAAFATYCAVNRRFAAALERLLRPGDTIWVQDYHLIPLGQQLGRLGVHGPIGFFLHTPFPPPETFAALPWARELADAFRAYDLVGLQTQACADNLRALLRRFASPGPVAGGAGPRDGHDPRIGVHPVGIDARAHAALAGSAPVAARAAAIRRDLAGRLGIAGVDRLDYSKGLPERLRAMEALLENRPDLIERVTLCQIAAPSRERVPEYRALRAELAAQAGRINARFGGFGWMPVHFLNRGFGPVDVSALMRACRVGLVTPLRDGMNLVAKEYVAAQDPSDPGVLVLSRFAGAAEQLGEALIVNPHDAADTAAAIFGALEMPRAERLRRWHSLVGVVATYDAHRWQSGFLRALAQTAGHRAAYASTAA